jgi:hypothetical protein
MQETLDRTFEHMMPTDIEINLVIASKDRLVDGFANGNVVEPIPIKAHFVSRAANHPYASKFGGAYLTAAHSSGDYPFESTIEEIVNAVNEILPRGEEKIHMPPSTNIIRPYYSPDHLFRHVERIDVLRAIGNKGLNLI